LVEAGGDDTDGDGVVDGFTDTDGDGFDDGEDTTEGGTPLANPDTDNDGVDDRLDLDSDNDGIQDVIEAGGDDPDGDGVIGTGPITDTDGDGFSDITDTDDNTNPGAGDGGTALDNPDTDNDGIADTQDLDSDNDGMTDANEAGGTDANGDGIIDGFTDGDGDGFNDGQDTTQGGVNLPQDDTDGDADYLDIDSDNDGIPDNIEAQSTDDYEAPTGIDSDGDGIDNRYDPDNAANTLTDPEDTDGDGTPDYQDLDSDDDGLTDDIEGWDTNNDGVADTVASGTDSDNDGLDDAYDTVDNSTAVNDGTNNTDPEDYPDNNVPGGDRDWRQIANQPPVATDDVFTGVEDTSLTGNVITGDNGNGTDSDPDAGDTLTVASATVDVDGDGTQDNLPIGTATTITDNSGNPIGTITLNSDGSLSFVPAEDFTGNVPQVTYTLTDDKGATDTATVDINILPDNDGDGIADVNDIDDDNDGIPDTVEGTGDTDGDGIPDSMDLDSDNDGIPDVIEAGGDDPDGDGQIGTGDITDTDGDGLSDIADTDDGGTALDNPDTDGDGIPDTQDLDSDNDGISDLVEAGGTDTDGDGVVDGYTDADGDGFDDGEDTTEGGTPLANPDTDNDGVDDRLDLDSDNDGIQDVIEAGGDDPDGDGVIGTGPITDTDGDGFSDITDTDDNTNPGAGDGGTALDNPDTDNDGIPDTQDLDSDNDGITDVNEAGGTDANGDGIVDGFTDGDGDGFNDGQDTTQGGVNLPQDDTDGDDYLDIDSDNDGIPDNIEAQGTDDYEAPLGVDSDGDGIDNQYDPDNAGNILSDPEDTDNDGTPDYQDTDSDNDGRTDDIEGWDTNDDGVADTTPSGTDSDNDGLDDAYDTVDNTSNPASGTNASNTTTPQSYPDNNNPGGDRDWRQELAEPDMTIIKTANPVASDATVGDVVTYTLVVTNTGNVTLDNIQVSDANATPNSQTAGTLTPGQSISLTVTHIITQEDMNNGGFDNQAIASTTFNGNPVTAVSDDGIGVGADTDDDGDGHPDDETHVDLTPNQAPEITVTLDDNDPSSPTNPSTYFAGDHINYTMNVENTGNVSVSNVTVPAGYTPVLDGAGFNVGDTNQDGILDPGEVWVYTSTHTLTQSEIDAGVYGSQESVSADFNGTAVTDSASDDPQTNATDDITNTYFNLISEISIVKVDALPANVAVGEDITYTITVSNNGNTTLSNVTVTDANATNLTYQSGDDGNGLMEPGEVWTYTATHTITQDDLDNGFVSNVASVSSTNPSGDPVNDDESDDPDTPDPDDPTVSDLTPYQSPALTTVKTVLNYIDNGLAGDSAGDVIEYDISVDNSGNVTLSNLQIIDLLVSNTGGTITYTSGDTDSDGLLDVDETWHFTASYTVTQSDIDNGSVENIAVAYALDSNGTPLNSIDNDIHTFVQDPQMEVTKVDALPSNVAVGEYITYTIVVTNTGNVTLDAISVSDTNATMNGVGSTPALAPGDSVTFTAVHQITQEDMDNGFVDNQATGTATAPNGNNINDLSDDTDDATDNDTEGDGEPDDVTHTDLSPYQVVSMEVTLDDNVQTNQNNPYNYLPGDVIDYTAELTNTGNVSIVPDTPAGYTAVLDPNTGMNIGDTDGDGVLDPGETWVYTTTHTVTQSDIDAGQVDNQVTFTGTGANGTAVSDVSDDPQDMTTTTDDVTTTYIGQNPEMTVEKTGVFNDANGNGVADSGETVTFTITVDNTGNVTISDVVVSDALLDAPNTPGSGTTYVSGDTNGNGLLDEDEVWIYEGTYTLTQADIDSGMIENQALVDGTYYDNVSGQQEPVSDLSDDPVTGTPEDATVVDLPVNPSIIITKVDALLVDFGPHTGYADPGDRIEYTFEVTNTGDQTLSDVDITDNLLDSTGGVVYVSGDLNGNNLLGCRRDLDIHRLLSVDPTRH